MHASRWLLPATVLTLLAGPLSAADFYVSPAGTGPGTKASPAGLQAALDAARASGEDDTLFLRAGAYDASDAGADTFDYDAGQAGSDGKAVTLRGGWDAAFATQGADPAATILDGGGTSRVLFVDAAVAGARADVTLERLTLRNGKTANPNSGGCAYVHQMNGAAALTVRDSVFQNCVAENAVGGAIYTNGPLAVSGSDFSGNQAYSGGAILIDTGAAPSGISDSRFWDNSIRVTTNPAHPWGWQGAIIFTNAPLTITGCEFRGMTDGSTVGDGSPIYAQYGGFLTVVNSSFRGLMNQHYGSAIQLWDAGGDISGCLFENNRAGGPPSNNGSGAITYLDVNTPPAETIRVVNSTFVGNRSDSDYSGDLDIRGGNLTVLNSIFFDTTSYALSCYGGCAGSVDYSSVAGGAASANGFTYGTHNTSANPLFAAGDSDYGLQAASPCVDTGSNAAPLLPATDLQGDPRVFAHLDPATPVVDMGWNEYYDGALEFTGPPEGATWLNDGVAKHITWSCTNVAGNVRLFLWKGPRYGGAEAREIAASVPCADQAYDWTIPADLPDATDYAVAMDSLLYPTVGHGRDVAIQHLHLASLDGGQVLRQGSTYAITWTSAGLDGSPVLIELYNGAVPARTIAAAAPNTGTFSWKVPFTLAPAGTYRLRISTATPFAAEDLSDADVTVIPAVTVTSPNGGQRWKRGLTYKIAWSFRNRPGGFVRIDLYRGTVLNRTIALRAPIGSAAASGTGYFSWTIPRTQAAGTNFKIRVRSSGYVNCFDLSNKPFTILR